MSYKFCKCCFVVYMPKTFRFPLASRSISALLDFPFSEAVLCHPSGMFVVQGSCALWSLVMSSTENPIKLRSQALLSFHSRYKPFSFNQFSSQNFSYTLKSPKPIQLYVYLRFYFFNVNALCHMCGSFERRRFEVIRVLQRKEDENTFLSLSGLIRHPGD